MLDIPELRDVESNITTVRLMDPTNLDVINVVHEWQRKMRTNYGYYKPIDTNMIKACSPSILRVFIYYSLTDFKILCGDLDGNRNGE